MAKLKLTTVLDDRPVKLTIEAPGSRPSRSHCLRRGAGAETGQTIEPAKLIAPMLARFMSTDRASRGPSNETTDQSIGSRRIASA